MDGPRGDELALSSVLSSIGGSVLLEGWPEADMDLVCLGRVELIAVEGVLPDTSVKLLSLPLGMAEYRSEDLSQTYVFLRVIDPFVPTALVVFFLSCTPRGEAGTSPLDVLSSSLRAPSHSSLWSLSTLRA